MNTGQTARPSQQKKPDRAKAELVLMARDSTPAERLEALTLIAELQQEEDRRQQIRAGGSDPTRYGHIQRGAESMEDGQSFEYVLMEHIAELSRHGNTSKELNIISYNGYQPKYDIRGWKRAEGKEEKLMKGVTLTIEEARALKNALNSRAEL